MTYVIPTTRRQILQRSGFGIGGIALGSMLAGENQASALGVDFAARAKSVIHIHMVGAPSQLDLFDPKPELTRRHGELCPDELFDPTKFAFLRERPTLYGSPQKWSFKRCGQSGMEISGLLPHLQTVADDLCLIRSMRTDEFNHGPAQMFMMTGFSRFGRPSLGSWVNYGLGSENADLPGFVVLVTGQVLGAGNSAWGSGFLPTIHQGVEFRSQGDPVLFLSNPPGIGDATRREVVQSVNKINREALADVGDPEIATRIDQYEMAYRMQSSVPELMDIRSEPAYVHESYGTTLRAGGEGISGEGVGKASFANNCLLARRLVERGVRFVQLFDQGWDHHGNIEARLPQKCGEVDRPIAALIRDLKQRGMLDDTLVVWSSEFGRTPMAQGNNGEGKKTKLGRDHHRDAYSMFMAGGGAKPATVFGQTDELGYSVVENPVHIHDFNATLLHLLGINHERLTFRHQGRQYRLTDVHGVVQEGMIA